MLSKEEFTEEILSNIDDMYAAYVKAQEAQSAKSPGDIFYEGEDNMPEFKASDPAVTEEEKTKLIESLEKAVGYERVAFTVGKVALKIGIKALTA